MKTGTPLHSSSALSAPLLPSRPALRVRTGQANALPQLSFKALFADIKPGAFEEMSKKTLAFRDEQARIEKARRQQKPREQDQLHGAAQPPAQPTSTVERARKAAPDRQEVRQPERVNARQAATQAETGRPTAPKATASEQGQARASQTDNMTQATQAVPTGQADHKAAAASQAPAPGNDTGKHLSAEAEKAADAQAQAAPHETAPNDLPQAVADALAYIEAQSARESELARHAALAQSDLTAVDEGAGVALDATLDDATAQVSAGQQVSTEATLDLAQTTAVKAHEAAPTDTTADALALTEDGDMPQATAGMAGGQDAANPQSGQGKKSQPGQPMMALAQSISTAGGSTTHAAQAAAITANPQTSGASTLPNPAAASQDTTSLAALSASNRADGAPAGVGVALPVQSGHSPTRADGSPLISSRIDAGIHTQAFKEQFAKQVAGLMVQGQDRAEIRLTPAELGPIRIRVSLSADDAQLDISAAHASTRAAIEASMSTLRQMLSEQGIRLADYRMDNGQNPVFAQNRQNGQELSSNMQQNGTAFGQGGNGSEAGREGAAGRNTGRTGTAAGAGSVAGVGQTGGTRRGTATTTNGRVDLFA
ncbi:MAG: flagellar hook-length control protein FliK [Lautropia sp.]|nr:flagellar hook-length control protein FliK [Lautropia sp.]